MTDNPPQPDQPGVEPAAAERPSRLARPARLLRLLLLLLLGGALATGLLYLAGWLRPETPGSGSPGDSNGREKTDASLACLGYADLASGVSSLVPLQAGVVKEVVVKEGGWVKEGAELVRLDDRLQGLRVSEAEAALKAAQTGLKQAEEAKSQHQGQVDQQQYAVIAANSRVNAARDLLRHKKQLRDQQLLSAAELDAAENQVKELEAMEKGQKARLDEIKALKPGLTVERAKAECEVSEVRLEEARQAKKECVLVAPQSGTVLRLLASTGDAVGAAIRQPALQFAPDGPILIRAEVDQEFANRVEMNRAAIIYDDTDPSQRWTGKVTRVGRWFSPRRLSPPEGAAVGGPLALECIITLDPTPNPPRINQRVRVLILKATGKVS